MPQPGELAVVKNELPLRDLKQNIVSVQLSPQQLKRLAQSRRDREREIERLENEMRRVQAQPGSELLVERYLDRINRLRQRNQDGLTRLRLLNLAEGHNPRLWPGA